MDPPLGCLEQLPFLGLSLCPLKLGWPGRFPTPTLCHVFVLLSHHYTVCFQGGHSVSKGHLVSLDRKGHEQMETAGLMDDLNPEATD